MKFNKSINSVITFFMFSLCALASPAFAAGGLADATTMMEDLKTWLFGFIGLAAIIYMMYNIAMAFMERKSWGDVAMALVYCTGAGGALAAGNWALEVFQ